MAKNKTVVLPGAEGHRQAYVDGKPVVGASTIAGLIDKSRPLMYWVYNMMKEHAEVMVPELMASKGYELLQEFFSGESPASYEDIMGWIVRDECSISFPDPFASKDKAADAGTVGHYLIECYLNDEEPDEEYKATIAPALWDLGENSFLQFLGWEEANPSKESILVEKLLASKEHKFGGTPDWYRLAQDGARELVDFKTGKAIDKRKHVPYDSYKVQAAGYAILLEENGYPVDRVTILQLPRDEDESFDHAIVTTLDACKRWFLHLRAIYDIKKEA